MKRRMGVSAFLAVVVAAGCLVSSVLAETRARVLSVKEVRYKDLTSEEKTEEEFLFNSFQSPKLTLTVELRGEEAAKATRYGFVSVKTAVDDTGKDLKDAPDDFAMDDDSFTEIDRNMMYFGMDEEELPKDNVKIDLTLVLPSRSAKSLPLVEGSLKLLVGNPAKVVVEGVRQKVGQAVQDPRLAKCGVQVKIIPAKADGMMFGMGPEDPSKAVGIQVSGKLDAVSEICLLDGQGEELNTGKISMERNASKTYFLESMDPLPANTKLEITVSEGQKEVEVPFKFEDIPLP